MPALNLSSGIRLNYLDQDGAGPSTVLLLHGLGVNGASWALQIPVLTGAGFRVLAPDVRGFGQSRYPGGSMAVSVLASDMVEMLGALGLRSAAVVGISMGGAIALQIALDHPEVVEKLVLTNTFARLRPERPGVWLYYSLRMVLVHTLGLRAQAQAVSRHLFPDKGQAALRELLVQSIRQADLRAYRAAMRGLMQFDVRNRLRDVRAPTLVITGAVDNTVPPPLQRSLLLGIPGAQQVVIPGAGHAVIADHPEAFNQVLLSFLQG